MYDKVYIDVVFVTNLLMDYFLLRLVGTLLLRRKSRGRCLSGGHRRPVFLPYSLCTKRCVSPGDHSFAQRLCHGNGVAGMRTEKGQPAGKGNACAVSDSVSFRRFF